MEQAEIENYITDIVRILGLVTEFQGNTLKSQERTITSLEDLYTVLKNLSEVLEIHEDRLTQIERKKSWWQKL